VLTHVQQGRSHEESEEISTILLTIEPSRWGPAFRRDWDLDIEYYLRIAFQQWALERPERTIKDWDGIDKLRQVVKSPCLNSVKRMAKLLTFSWSPT
jgi:hypothetical protein